MQFRKQAQKDSEGDGNSFTAFFVFVKKEMHVQRQVQLKQVQTEVSLYLSISDQDTPG